ncbi:MAG: hypothetical protein AB1478_01295, partial [Nitrospirota bacterium]
ILNKELFNIKIYLILNQIKKKENIMIGNSVKSVCMKYFGLNAQYVGYIEHDDCICKCINERQPFMRAYPSSRCTQEIKRITENLLNKDQVSIKGFKYD